MNSLRLFSMWASKTAVGRATLWVAGELWEKINIVETWRGIKKMGMKHGLRFIIFAVIWEFIEDVVFPYLAWKNGMPQLMPFFWIFHFEPITWPTAIWVFRVWDRHRGLEPAEPDRAAQSTYWRSVGKVAVYKVSVAGWYVAILASLGLRPAILAVHFAMMTAFGFVHERIWHDSNYGIRLDDSIEAKRVLAKTLTYCIVSTTVLTSLFRMAFGSVRWDVALACQAIGIGLYFAFETVWAKSRWGIVPVVERRVHTPILLADPAIPARIC